MKDDAQDLLSPEAGAPAPEAVEAVTPETPAQAAAEAPAPEAPAPEAVEAVTPEAAVREAAEVPAPETPAPEAVEAVAPETPAPEAQAAPSGVSVQPAGPATTPPGGPAAQAFSQPQSGTWVWLPQGPGPKTPWRKRHPLLFWGGMLLILGLVFGWGRMSAHEKPSGGPKIAVVAVEGIIMDASSIVSWMDKVRQDDSYKGVIMRINSPGGAVGPSQEIYAAVKRMAGAKPTVVAMGALAASGGYYAALGAERIIAGPSTLTASIGVKMQLPNIGELMRTLGVSEKTLSTGALKDAGNAWREMSPEEEAYFRALIDDMYTEFIEVVAKERELSLDEVRLLADGRAMTGRQALAAGLVDELGDLYTAESYIAERAGLEPGEALLENGPPRPTSWLEDYLGATLNGLLDGAAWQRQLTQPLFYY